MDRSVLRRNMWIVVLAVAALTAASGLPLLVFFLPKISVLAGRFVVEAQLKSRSSGAAVGMRELHAVFGAMIFGAALLAVGLSVSRSRWRSRVLTAGPAVVIGVWVADVTGRILTAPELAQPVAGVHMETVAGAVPLSVYLAHVLGGLGAVLGVVAVWAISRRAGRTEGAAE